MVTSVSSSHKLPVRFRAPAPIFFIPVIIALMCVSAGAVSISENQVYSMSEFPFYWSTSDHFNLSDVKHFPADQLSATGNTQTAMIVASGSQSGSTSGNSSSGYKYPLSFFDLPSPNFRFVRVGFSVPLSALGSSSYLYSCSVDLYYAISGETLASRARLSPSWSNNSPTLSVGSGGGVNCYYYDAGINGDTAYFTAYYSIQYNAYFCGLLKTQGRPSNLSSSSSWFLDFSNVTIEFSNTKFIPPSTGSGGGSVDFSGITSQINSLSAQMTSSFQQVNANIDSAESAISSAISEQTTELTGAIDGAADSVNDHFDDWDQTLSGAFSSSDAAAVVAADQAVSELHQIESDQIDDTGQALDDTGLSGYSMPSDYDDGLAAIGQMFTLFFDSLSFITPLIIFSCTLGLASVLVGRKSKSDSGGD